MKRALTLLVLLLSLGVSLRGQEPYFPPEALPDLIQSLPAPPEKGSPAFRLDLRRYRWGKRQRKDSVRVAQVCADAVWTYEALVDQLDPAFGLDVSRESTPRIWTLLERSLTTIDPIRVASKAYFHRIRPFEYFHEHTLTGEDDILRGEGSYPSGHTMRSWLVAMIFASVHPATAEAVYARAWTYGENRVIAGAHWQSDVDVSRVAAAIGYARLVTSPDFLHDLALAQEEFARVAAQ